MTKKLLQSLTIAILGISLISSCSYLGLERKACSKTEKSCKKTCHKGKKCDKSKKCDKKKKCKKGERKKK